jgi:alkanesulfonate monooxygenase SsuD/methylene tetrahydromethanopterin reductase-like flavin-dependent oxidoreductase (luciferase family)
MKMRVGVAPLFQNYADWERYDAVQRGEDGGPMLVEDAEIWREQLAFCDLVEPLGFDSLWTFEHRNSPYIMLPNPQQFLSYVAGRTKRIDVGTMVTILPWHNPVRLAENIAMLQHMMGPKRKIMLGFGRGLARREFESLGIPLEESRERFSEALEVLKLAFHNEKFSYEGRHFQHKNTQVRPHPLDASVIDNAYAVWTSRDSMNVAAQMGLNPLTLPAKSLQEYANDMGDYGLVRGESGHPEGKKTIIQVFMYCCESEQEAREGATQYFTEYGDSAVRHYEIGGEHFKTTKGYEQYRPGGQSNFSGEDSFIPSLVREGLVGTPEQCIERAEAINTLLGPYEMVAVSTSGSMRAEAAEKSLRLFAEKALPTIHEMKVKDVVFEPRAETESQVSAAAS